MRRAMMIAAVAIVLAAGCSAGRGNAASTVGTASPATTAPSPASTAAGAPPGLSAADLKGMLLTVSDLPTGWSVDNSSKSSADDTTNGFACMQPIEDENKNLPNAGITFVQGSLPQMVEGLTYDGPTVAKRFDDAVKTLDGCTDVSIASNGQTAKGSIGAMSFPTVGDESAAYAANLDLGGVSVGIDLVIARKGDVALVMFLVDGGSPDTTMLQTSATKALAKVPAP